MKDEMQRIEALLDPDERVLWTGRPDKRVVFTPMDRFLIPIAIAMSGLATYFFVSVLTSGAQKVPLLVGTAFLSIAFYALIGRFLLKSYKKQGTIYALTSHRAMVLDANREMWDAPVGRGTVPVTRNGEHVTVRFGRAPSWNEKAFANAGLDFLFLRNAHAVTFNDVASPEPLLAHLQADGT
jgi:hypothetical protein